MDVSGCPEETKVGSRSQGYPDQAQSLQAWRLRHGQRFQDLQTRCWQIPAQIQRTLSNR